MTATTAGTAVHQVRPGAPGGLRVAVAHGLEDGWATWLPMIDSLDPDWQVQLLDLPWRAGTDYRWRSTAGAADWLAAGLPPMTDLLVAHSFGATAALELMAAGALPGTAVVLVCPLYRPSDSPVSWQLLDAARAGFEAHIRESVRARMGERARLLDPAVLEGMMSRTLERVGPTGLLTVFDRFTASAEIPVERISQRVLVIAGPGDPTLSPRAAHLLAGRIGGAQVVVDDHFDHFCYVRHPRRVARYVLDFARGRPLPSAVAVVDKGA